MGAPSLHIDSWLQVPPDASTEARLDAAMLRAYPIGRAADYGCSLDDILKLHRRVANGTGWVETALLLGADNLARAEAVRRSGAPQSAAAFYLHAAACFRLAQAALEEHPERRLDTYRRNVDAFTSAMVLLGHAGARLEIGYRGAPHGAWLFEPEGAPSGAPCVLVVGGADGWCEAFYSSVAAFLERGIAVCLLELPGQGLARLQHGSFLDAAFPEMVSAALDQLAARDGRGGGFGILGHSLGGTLALRTAASDKRIQACCTNGGAVRPLAGLRNYPRALQRVGRMLRDGCGETEVQQFFARLGMVEAVPAMTIPVLCLQGGQDSLVSDDAALELPALRGAGAVTYAYWPEGVHCLYDHAAERNAFVADWFARQLGVAEPDE